MFAVFLFTCIWCAIVSYLSLLTLLITYYLLTEFICIDVSGVPWEREKQPAFDMCMYICVCYCACPHSTIC